MRTVVSSAVRSASRRPLSLFRSASATASAGTSASLEAVATAAACSAATARAVSAWMAAAAAAACFDARSSLPRACVRAHVRHAPERLRHDRRTL
eukprot:4240562-Pleurochrysis_carterae.AAC.3